MDESLINRFEPYNVRDESGRVTTLNPHTHACIS